MPFPVVAFLGLCKVCAVVGGTIFCAHKASKAYEKGQKTKQEKYALKGKSLEAVKEDNKKAQTESDEWKRKYEEIEQREKQRDIEIRNIRDELKDPNISKKQREDLEERLASLLASQDDDKNEKKKILDKIKQLGERIKENNKTISGVGLNPDGKHWVWDLFTLENALILGGCYLLYKIASDDK